jgi:P-type Cu+ transporter
MSDPLENPAGNPHATDPTAGAQSQSAVPTPTAESASTRVAAPRWVCPMCAGVESTRPGNCPKCGLALDPSTLPLDADVPNLELRSMLNRFLVALFLALPMIAASLLEQFVERSPLADFLDKRDYITLQAVVCSPIVLICGWPILSRAWRSIRTGRPNIFTLTGLGIGAAYGFSLVIVVLVWLEMPLIPVIPKPVFKPKPTVEVGLDILAPSARHNVEPLFDAASILVVLTLLGQVLELRARARTSAAIRRLIRLTPETACVLLPDGREEVRPLEHINPGDLVRVRTSERIPVDGIVREGTTTVDESLLTGEPMRVGKGPGMSVIAGTENGLGEVIVEAQRVKGDTALAHIVMLVEQAQRSWVPLQRTVDRIAAWFIPFVIIIASATYAGWASFGPPGSITTAAVCAIGVLVAACPVALGLATPTAVVFGMARAARAGILFRDGASLERFSHVDTIVFDKTGTLTEGKMKLVAVLPNVGLHVDEFLALAAAVERGNQHPIGLAIVWEAASRGLRIPVAEDVEYIPGKGVHGKVDGQIVVVGKYNFMQQSGAHREPMLSETRTHRSMGRSVIYVGRGDYCAGVIVMEDPLRPTAKPAVDSLRAAGLRLIMLTGDDAETANGVAKAVGIEEVIADTLPLEKYAVVQKLKNEGRSVAMCGDGINDAPALAAADVGIAMGTGTDAAITIARVAIVQPDLRGVAVGRDVSRLTVRTIRQNLFIAFLYTVIALPLAAGVLFPFGGGLISPMLNALGMTVSSLAIVGNSAGQLGRRR